MDTIQLYIKVSKAHINVLKKKYSRPSCEQVRFVKMIQNRIVIWGMWPPQIGQILKYPVLTVNEL